MKAQGQCPSFVSKPISSCHIQLNPRFKSTREFKVKVDFAVSSPSSRAVKEGRVLQTQILSLLSLPDDIFNTMSTRREANFFHMAPSYDTERGDGERGGAGGWGVF